MKKTLTILFFVFLSVPAVPALQAAEYCVDKTADGAPDHTRCSAACVGTCSLRDAIAAVDINGGTSTINIRPGTYGISGTAADRGENTNNVGDYDINVVDPLTIQGDGASTTIIDGAGVDRVFHVLASCAANVTIKDLTVRNGNASDCGGGFYLESESTLNSVTVKDNVSNSNGGGVCYNIGDAPNIVNIESSSIFGNEALGGGGGVGGLGNAGNLRIVNATIASNKADGPGGGIFANNLTLRNVTVSGNTSDDDGDNGAGENGGGILILGGFNTIRNSIIANNIDKSVGGGAVVHPDCSATISVSTFSLYENLTGCTLTASTSDLSGLDPQLDTILDVFGAETEVLRLKNGSPALNAGDPAGCKNADDAANLSADQRGFARPAGARCDMGAYEKGGCGDGGVDFEEACDDGNASDTDACRNTCEAAACGDGVVRAGVEACDDGNAVDDDACSNACALASCGNGVVNPGEECDDGAGNSNTGADACRLACLDPSCGDGVTDTGEECDDGNATDGDGCSASCEDETGGTTGSGTGGDSGGGCSLIR